MTYQDKGKRFRHFTKQKIENSHWKDQRIKNQCSSASEINGILDDLENIVKGILREAVFSKQEFSVELVRRKFESQIGKAEISSDFFSSYDDFIKMCRSTKSYSTIQAYQTTKNKLIEFQAKTKEELNFSKMTQTFYDKFIIFLLEDQKLLNNSVGKHIKTLKTFLNFSMDHDFTKESIQVKIQSF